MTALATKYDGEQLMPRGTNELHLLAAINTQLDQAMPGKVVRVLDAGCGDGYFAMYLEQSFRVLRPDLQVLVFGFDVDDFPGAPPGSELSKRQYPQSSATGWDPATRIRLGPSTARWPYPDHYFNIVISNQVLEHVADLDLFFRELSRVLKRDGLGIHVFPLRRTLWEWHLHMPLVHRVRDRSWQLRLIKLFAHLRLGTFYQFKGMTPALYAEMCSAYLETSTNYVDWAEINNLSDSVGLCASLDYTPALYAQKLRALASRNQPLAYRCRSRNAAVGRALTHVFTLQLLARLGGVTVCMGKHEGLSQEQKRTTVPQEAR